MAFWVDLSTAHLIDQSFNKASETVSTGAAIASLIPTAKIGNGNYIYVYNYTSVNYFGISAVIPYPGTTTIGGVIDSNPGLTVAQAAAIDSKIDDGLPQTGNVLAQFINWPGHNFFPTWAPSQNQPPAYGR